MTTESGSISTKSVAIMITTHNRLSELQRTWSVLSNLAPQPGELLITADGCTDGTEQWVKENIPEAKLFVNAPGQGSIPSRDRMLRETMCDLVLSLDDDSYPMETDAITKIANWFADKTRVGVATFPLNTEEHPETLAKTTFKELGEVATFPNCAACFDVGVYKKLPGFPEFFFHSYEEPDYGLQCITNDYVVFHTNIVTIRHHWTSLGRDEIKVHQGHARNELWSSLMRVPMPWLPGIVLYRVVSQFRYACTRGIGWVILEPFWWWRATKGIAHCLRNRKPVSWSKYRKWLRLLREANLNS